MRSKEVRAVIFCGIFLMASASYAEEIALEESNTYVATLGEVVHYRPKPPAPSEEKKECSSRIQLGADYTYLIFDPEDNTSFDGNLGGLQGLYEYRPMEDIYAGLKFAWKQGSTSGSSGERSMLYIDAEERIGYTF